jgi:M6 family metalloprotease-like protein
MTKPVLLLLVQYSDVRFQARHTPAFYRNLLFGPSFPNVAGFFAENSGGLFRIREAGILTVTMPDDPSTTENESLANCGPWARDAAGNATCPGSLRGDGWDRAQAVLQASRAGFDFKAYDANNDGNVSDDELMVVLVLASATDNCGALRGYAPWPLEVGRTGRRVSFQVFSAGAFGENADFATVAHEMSHSLGTIDLYGPWNDRFITMNPNATLMGGTCNGVDRRWSVNLEAWHRIQLGWVRPRVHALTQGGACFWLDSANRLGASPSPNRAPILLWDPARGPNEFFLVEHRRQSRAEQPEGNGVAPSSRYDADTADTGVAVWWVRHGGDAAATAQPIIIERGAAATSRLVTTPALRTDDVTVDADMNGLPDFVSWGWNNRLETSQAVVTVGSGRARRQIRPDLVASGAAVWVAAPRQNGTVWETGPMGMSQYFKRQHGQFRLIWPGGRDSGFRIRLGRDADPVAVHVEASGARGSPSGTSGIACYAQAAPDANGPPRIEVPRCIERPTIADRNDSSRRVFDPSVAPIVVARVTLPDALRASATLTLTVRAGGAMGGGTRSLNSGDRSADFPLVLTGHEHDRIELDARLTRSFTDRAGTATTTASAWFLVTPDQRLRMDDSRFTCSDLDRLEARAHELRRLAYRERIRVPLPDPDPYFAIHPAALAKAKVRVPPGLKPFLNRTPAGALRLPRKTDNLYQLPAKRKPLGHFALQHLDLQAFRIGRRLSVFSKSIRPNRTPKVLDVQLMRRPTKILHSHPRFDAKKLKPLLKQLLLQNAAKKGHIFKLRPPK